MALTITLASLTTLGYAAWYILISVLAPWRACRRCHGTGHTGHRGARRGQDCRPCDGTGRRVRLGRRLYEHLATEYRTGTR